LIEFLFWHALLFIFSCCLNLKWCRGYSVHFVNNYYNDDDDDDGGITFAAWPYLPGLLQSLSNRTPIISSVWLYELMYVTKINDITLHHVSWNTVQVYFKHVTDDSIYYSLNTMKGTQYLHLLKL